MILENSVSLITGGARGIGEGLVRKFASGRVYSIGCGIVRAIGKTD